MGSSSKKVKTSKESRKRRHRSRSYSDDEVREKERHRHRKHHSHRERRHEKRERHREYESEDSSTQDKSPPQIHTVDSSPERSPTPNDQRSADSLSIEETNKLRAKLGLKPLEVTSKEPKDEYDRKDGKIKDDLGEFYHKPAESLGRKKQEEKLRTKLAEKKEKRKLETKLSKVKTLGESDEDEDVKNWVLKNRKIQYEKDQAAKRAKALEELDAEFGIGEIIESETKLKRAKIYGDKHLKGLRVEHNIDTFEEGKNVILTLKDADILEEKEDVLVNVNIIDDERYKKSVENKKKKPGYQAYDNEEFDEEGNYKGKTLLGKYDEEIDGEKRDSFVIGQSLHEKKRLAETVKEKLSNKRLESLVLPQLNLASEYYTEEEMVKFKKPKKRVKKLRQKGRILSAADLAATLKEEDIGKDLGSRRRPKIDLGSGSGPSSSHKGDMTDWMAIDDVPDVKPPTMNDLKLEADDITLELALRKARRLKQKENLTSLPPVTASIKDEPMEDNGADTGNITLNSTAEFCRTLGDIPTYGRSGNRDEEKDLVDFEGEIKESPPPSPPRINAWNPIDPMEAIDSVALPPETPILDEEPDVGSGVGAALKLAMSKGYLDKEENNRPSSSRLAHLQAKHYSIEDKTYGDDDKFGGNRRERHNGPTQDFKEKDTFRPNVKLEYIDDDGRVLNAKEAFRYLSHKFHGKGPGKNKIEKRIKKSDQEVLMKKMSSTDTPLGTLNMLQHKQKEMQSPFIVLSGSKHTHSTTISKTRR